MMKQIDYNSLENIVSGADYKKVGGNAVKVFTTSRAFAEHCRGLHGEDSEDDQDIANNGFREKIGRYRKSLTKKYVKDYAMTYADCFALFVMHYEAARKQNFAKCFAIEEIFTDLNCHFESGCLYNGRYKDAVDFTKKEQEEYERYWAEQERLIEDEQCQQDSLVEAFVKNGFDVDSPTVCRPFLMFRYCLASDLICSDFFEARFVDGIQRPVVIAALREYLSDSNKCSVDWLVDDWRRNLVLCKQYSVRTMLEAAEDYVSKLHFVLDNAIETYNSRMSNRGTLAGQDALTK